MHIPDPRPRDGWFKIGKLDVTTTALLSLLGVVSMFLYAMSTSAFYRLAFWPPLVRDGELWRLVTWPIANEPSIWVFISIAFFWIFGHMIEEQLGKQRFALLVAVVVVAPATVVTLVGPLADSTAAAIGISLLGTVMLVLFAAEHPTAPFFFGIPAWVIAAVFVGLDVLRYLGERWWGTLVQMLLMVGGALVMARSWGFVTELSFIPKIGGGASGRPRSSGGGKRSRAQRQSRDFDRVVSGPWTGPSPADQAEMDHLLDKMNTVGLTDAERKRLSDLGKRLRGN